MNRSSTIVQQRDGLAKWNILSKKKSQTRPICGTQIKKKTVRFVHVRTGLIVVARISCVHSCALCVFSTAVVVVTLARTVRHSACMNFDYFLSAVAAGALPKRACCVNRRPRGPREQLNALCSAYIAGCLDALCFSGKHSSFASFRVMWQRKICETCSWFLFGVPTSAFRRRRSD